MKIPFTKMHGAGNDFVVLDATTSPVELSAAQIRAIANRQMGIGADQILMVGPPPSMRAGERPVDFSYRIFNADGGEVEQCGNGARAFVRFVHDKHLTRNNPIRVATQAGVIEPFLETDGSVTVDMGAPHLATEDVPFDETGLTGRMQAQGVWWPVDIDESPAELAVVSMGNPHAIQIVPSVDDAEVARLGPLIECHPRFPRRVNAGFLQIVGRSEVRLRVWERGAGETLACGTGACAAVVVGILAGLLDSPVQVGTRGGSLSITWPGPAHAVLMNGPAVSVFDGELNLAALVLEPEIVR